ncbi:MAG TPA: hypothetical protein PLP17_15340 [Oligoflexia bacterium]|nr:hypothetical protein [Oligoflexia bacterium]
MSDNQDKDYVAGEGALAKDDKRKKREQAILHAFFDGEVSADERLYVQQKLEADDAEFKKELQSLDLIRQELRSWVGEQLHGPGTEPHRVDLWSKLESRLAKGEGLPPRGLQYWTERMLDVCSGLREFWLQPQVLAPVFTVIVLAFYIGYLSGGSSIDEPTAVYSRQMAGVNYSASEKPPGILVSAAPAMNPVMSNNQLITMVSSSTGRADGARRYPLPFQREPSVKLAVAGSNLLASKTGGFERTMPLVHRRLSVIRRAPVDGGLRAGSSDIDWVKTDKQFRIIQADEPTAPPVIWLSNDAGVENAQVNKSEN